MKKRPIEEIVAEAIAINKKIDELDTNLKALKQEIVSEAKLRLTGMAVAANGEQLQKSCGLECPQGKITVTFPSPSIQKIEDPATEKQVLKLCGKLAFSKLFSKATVFKPVKGFREVVDIVLPAKAKEIFGLLEKENAPRISYGEA